MTGNRMRIGLFGGSFNPIHDGHIVPVVEAKQRFELDRVIYLPTARPPHKEGREFAPAHKRYAMVELALLAFPDLLVSSHELTLGRRAYTVETLEYFKQQEPESDLYLIIGADSFNELDQWKRFRDILDLARLVVLARPGWDELRPDLPPELRDLDEDRLLWLETHQVDQSSTRIREQLHRGSRPAKVPEAVLDFCQKYELY